MAVAFVIAGDTHGGSTSTLTISVDVSSGSGRAAIVGIGFSDGSSTVSSVTVGSDSLALITGTNGTSSGGGMLGEMWGGLLSVTGTQTVTVTFTGATNSIMEASIVVASGCDTSTPINNGTKEMTGALTIAITSNSGDLTTDFIASLNSDISAPTQTQRVLVNTGGFRYGASTGTGGAGPISHAWTVSSYLSQVAQCGANFKAGAASGPTTAQLVPTFEQQAAWQQPGVWWR